MIRNPNNHNHKLHTGEAYQQYPTIIGYGALIENYLEALHFTLQRALAEHPRTLAVRFDLRYPQWMTAGQLDFSNEVIKGFFKSLKAIIKHDRAGAAHRTSVRYVWAREVGFDSCDGRPHFHVLLLLNRDAYRTLGSFDSQEENLYKRIRAAWARALGLPDELGSGLAHIPENPVYKLDRGDDQAYGDVFYRASYLCKQVTKDCGCEGRYHSFGHSRI